MFLKLHKPAIADKRYRLILMPSARTIAKPQERKEIALNAINRMQNQIKKPYYSHAAKYRPSSTETSNAGVRAETSSDPTTLRSRRDEGRSSQSVAIPRQKLSQEESGMSEYQGLPNFPISEM